MMSLSESLLGESRMVHFHAYTTCLRVCCPRGLLPFCDNSLFELHCNDPWTVRVLSGFCGFLAESLAATLG